MREHLLPPSRIAPGALLAGCRVVREIARGGMGIVYLAEHLTLRRKVAIKVLPRSVGENKSEDDKQIQRFLNEARAASSIEHPNVVSIYDAGTDGDVHYIVMQFVDGRNLSQLREEYGGPLPWWVAAKLIRAAAKGLHAVHEKGLLHRDVKPSNIMVASDGRVLVMDFGLVRGEVEHDLTTDGNVVGTIAYMSPEQSRGEKLDRRTDIFSLGGTLYTLLANCRPYPGSLRDVMAKISRNERPPPIEPLVPGLPPGIVQLLGRALTPQRANRLHDAATFARALATELQRQLTDDESTLARPPLQGRGAVPELELVALERDDASESVWDDVAFIQWFVGGAVLSALLFLALLLNLQFGWPGAAESAARPYAAVPQPQKKSPAVSVRSPDATGPGLHAGMVLIPAGPARLGNSRADLEAYVAQHVPRADDAAKVLELLLEEPEQTVSVPAFWIDSYEVTNGDYAKFVAAAHWTPPPHWKGATPPRNLERAPVVHVTRADAEAYAQWAGKQLPTRAQWMRAYRGDTKSLFPWGNEYIVSRTNVYDNPDYPNIAPVTGTPDDVSPFQVYNLVGNVSEILRETAQPQGQLCSVVKGGDFASSGFRYGIGCSHTFLTIEGRHLATGFRCVVDNP
jgi:formylglycine-generating enzyme required for sulfatase activity/tRNA A-37 threonylcarbamoyl transferase component Bud32